MRATPVLPDCLVTSAALRVPVFESGVAPATKIHQLEDHLLLSAWYQGECAEARLGSLVDLVPLKDRWDHLENWEHLRQGRTNEAMIQAKRLVDPALYDAMSEVEWLIARLTEEIDRLERDATKCSRAYSMLTSS